MARHTPPGPADSPEQRLRALARPAADPAPVPDTAVEDTADLGDPDLAAPPPPPYADLGCSDGDPPASVPLPPPPAAPAFREEATGTAEAGGTEAGPFPARDRGRGDAPSDPPPSPDDPPPGYVRVLPSERGVGRRLPPLLAALLDRLPLPDGEDRPRLGRSGVSALAVVCLVAAGVTGWFVLTARPASAPAPPQAASPSGAAPSASPSPAGTVVVHVGGEVESPGVVTLPAGSRVADAVEAAGGLRPDTDPGLLNLARPLVDGEQVLVGVTPSPAPAAGPAAPGAGDGNGRIDLNTATAEQLQTLPGVGPVLSQRIVDYRTSNGGFTSVEQLRDVTGIGDRRFADLRGLVHVGGVS